MKKSFYVIVFIIPSFLFSMESPKQQVIKLSPRSSTVTSVKSDSQKGLTRTRRLTDSDPIGRVRSQSLEKTSFTETDSFKKAEGSLTKSLVETKK